MQLLINIADNEAQNLKHLAILRQTSENLLVEKAISDWLKKQTASPHPMREAFGIWKNNPNITDGLAYQQQLRDEWQDRE